MAVRNVVGRRDVVALLKSGGQSLDGPFSPKKTGGPTAHFTFYLAKKVRAARQNYIPDNYFNVRNNSFNKYLPIFYLSLSFHKYLNSSQAYNFTSFVRVCTLQISSVDKV